MTQRHLEAALLPSDNCLYGLDTVESWEEMLSVTLKGGQPVHYYNMFSSTHVMKTKMLRELMSVASDRVHHLISVRVSKVKGIE